MSFAIYGANGYSGRLIAREAVARGNRPTLIGRDRAAVAALAEQLDLPWAWASLDQPDSLREALSGHRAVLHCAGPFDRTAAQMVAACLAWGVSYLDITGEISVIETVAKQDIQARARGVVLICGVGFDVVPSDCLAAHLARRLPDAVRLTLAFTSSAGVSRGTALTMVNRLGQPGAVRKEGRLRPVPVAWRTRTVDFGRGPRLAVSLPWGDLATAHRTTGIGDVEVYAAVSRRALWLLRGTRWLAPLLATRPVRSLLESGIRRRVTGPDDADRARGRSVVWGEVVNVVGRAASSRVMGPEGYTMTALTAVRAAERVARGEVQAGYHTPARAFGSDFVLELPGTTREDLT